MAQQAQMATKKDERDPKKELWGPLRAAGPGPWGGAPTRQPGSGQVAAEPWGPAHNEESQDRHRGGRFGRVCILGPHFLIPSLRQAWLGQPTFNTGP